MSLHHRNLVFLLIAAAACSPNVPRDNANDPDATVTKNDGRIKGSVYIFGAAQAGWEVIITDESGAPVSAGLLTGAGDLNADEFESAKIPGGIYDLEVMVPIENTPIIVAGIEVLPGLTTDVGLLTSPALPAAWPTQFA